MIIPTKVFCKFHWFFNFYWKHNPKDIDQQPYAKWKVSLCFHVKRQDALGWLQMPPRRPKDGFPCPRRRPSGPSRYPQDDYKRAPRRLQDDARCRRDGSNFTQLLERLPRSPPDHDFGPSRPRFCTPSLPKKQKN